MSAGGVKMECTMIFIMKEAAGTRRPVKQTAQQCGKCLLSIDEVKILTPLLSHSIAQQVKGQTAWFCLQENVKITHQFPEVTFGQSSS